MAYNLRKGHVLLLCVLIIVAIVCAVLIGKLAYTIFFLGDNSDLSPIVELEVQHMTDYGYEITSEDTDIEEYNQDNIELLFSFAGDCTIGGNYPPADQIAEADKLKVFEDIYTKEWRRQGGDYAYFFKLVKPIFESSDMAMVNLEGALTTSTERADKKFAFKGHPEFATILKEGSIDVVTLANNHTMDYGMKGYQDTKKALDAHDILYCDENTIAYSTYKDVKVAFLGFPGWYLEVKPKLKNAIHEATEKAHIVIVSFHWGDERSTIPNEVQMELAHYAIDEGATLVLGHHPHVIQGIEIYRDRYIVYSLANFSFGGNSNPKDKDTFIFQQKFTLDGDTKEIKALTANIIPCKISSVDNRNNFQPMPVEGEEGERILNRIYEASSIFESGLSRD